MIKVLHLEDSSGSESYSVLKREETGGGVGIPVKEYYSNLEKW